MNTHKRSKRSRIRGGRRCGYGFGKKHRGKGSRGGVGMAGTGKRAAQKRTFIDKFMPDYFGKHGFKSIGQIRRLKSKIINLSELDARLKKFLSDGTAKKTSEGIEVSLPDFKILGKGEIKEKLIVKAKSASLQAIEKVGQAGGKIIVEENFDLKPSEK